MDRFKLRDLTMQGLEDTRVKINELYAVGLVDEAPAEVPKTTLSVAKTAEGRKSKQERADRAGARLINMVGFYGYQVRLLEILVKEWP